MNVSIPVTALDPSVDSIPFIDCVCNIHLIRSLAITSQWTDRLYDLPAEDLDCLVQAYQVIAAEAANVAAMKQWMQDPLYLDAIGCKED